MEQDRLVELEIKISHQELAIEKLQEQVYVQDATIQSLELSLKVLKARVEALAQGEGTIGPADQKPPHY